MDWARDLATWPHADASKQVLCTPHRWHVQDMGPPDAPVALMLHGAGGSTHSFRDLMTLLSNDMRVIAIDLPGQGFTKLGARHRSGLDAMAEDIGALLSKLDVKPSYLIGHSAGGAVALRLSQIMQVKAVIGINAALAQFEGLAGLMFPAMAKLLAMTPFTASVFSKASANPKRIQSLISGTGSKLPADGLGFYQRLVADRDHVDGTLLMMAQWDLTELQKSFGKLTTDVTLIACTNDKAVPAGTAKDAASKMPNSRYLELPDLGHLGHEEDPAQFADLIRTAINRFA